MSLYGTEWRERGYRLWRGHTKLCIFLTLSLTVRGYSEFESLPYPSTRSQSNGLAHRVGTRDIAWQLTTLSVQLYDPCTLSSWGVEDSTAASNLRDLSQPPYPLSLSLRFPLLVFAWDTYATSSQAGSGNRPRLIGSFMYMSFFILYAVLCILKSLLCIMYSVLCSVFPIL
jgi:hypothetical protein